MHLAKLNKEQLENVVEHILHSTKETGAGTLYHRFEEIIEDEVYSIDKDHAKEIVAHMRPYGEMFSMDSVRTMLQSHGVEHSDAHVCIRYYLVMNMQTILNTLQRSFQYRLTNFVLLCQNHL